MTNEELISEQSFHSAVDNYATWAGFGISGLAAKDFVKHIWGNRKITRGGAATLVIWVAVAGNKETLNRINEETRRRTKIKSSPLY